MFAGKIAEEQPACLFCIQFEIIWPDVLARCVYWHAVICGAAYPDGAICERPINGSRHQHGRHSYTLQQMG